MMKRFVLIMSDDLLVLVLVVSEYVCATATARGHASGRVRARALAYLPGVPNHLPR